MKREELKEIGLDDDAINKVMALHGKDITAAKDEAAKTTSELEQARAELQKANETLEKVKDYDQVKNEVEKYKTELETSRKEHADKLAALELSAKVKDFTNNYKFVNEVTRDAYNSKLADALNADENKGKSLEELFKGLTDGKENIFIDEKKPAPPTILDMASDKPQEDDAAVRAVMGLPPKK